MRIRTTANLLHPDILPPWKDAVRIAREVFPLNEFDQLHASRSAETTARP